MLKTKKITPISPLRFLHDPKNTSMNPKETTMQIHRQSRWKVKIITILFFITFFKCGPADPSQ
jgi:hypothetical protein